MTIASMIKFDPGQTLLTLFLLSASALEFDPQFCTDYIATPIQGFLGQKLKI